MDGIRYLILFSVVLTILPGSLATGDCACLHVIPGIASTVGVDCSISNTNNITLFHNTEVDVGEELWITAGKAQGGDILKARNLVVNLSLNGELFFSNLTNKDGIVVFVIEKAGTYTLSAGDAESTLTVIGEKEKAPLTLRRLIFILLGIQDAPYA